MSARYTDARMTIALRNALVGDWLRQDLGTTIAAFATTFSFRSVDPDVSAVRDQMDVYQPHPLVPELWSVPGAHRHAYLSDRTLWLRAGWRKPWTPHCRPGLDQLRAPCRLPSVYFDREALQDLAHKNAAISEIEFRNERVAGKPRCIVRLMHHGAGELRVWDHNGLFDLCELIWS
jgi:hypothetical protein